MWTAFKLFFSTNTARIMEWLAIAAAAIGTVIAIFTAGKKSARADALEKQVKQVEGAHEIENENRANLRDGDAAKRLRDEWSR